MASVPPNSDVWFSMSLDFYLGTSKRTVNYYFKVNASMVITAFYKNKDGINRNVLAPEIINYYPFNQAYPANNFFDLNAVISGNNYLPAFHYSGVNFYDTELQDIIGKDNEIFNFFNYDSIHGTISNTVNNFKLFSFKRDNTKPQPYYGTSYSYSTAPSPSDCIANVQITKLISPPTLT
jgi:hypothetical protein